MQSKTDRKVWIFIECEYRLSRSDYPTKKHANHATHYRIYLLYFTHSSEDTFRACNRQRLVYRKKNTTKSIYKLKRKENGIYFFLDFLFFFGFSLDFFKTTNRLPCPPPPPHRPLPCQSPNLDVVLCQFDSVHIPSVNFPAY